MEKIQFRGDTICASRGWRALKDGETIPENFMYFSPFRGWYKNTGPGGDVGHKQGDDFCPYPHAVPDTTPVAKSPRKAPKLQETSLKAHASQKDKAPSDCATILTRIRKYRTGTTCDKLEQVLGMSHQTTSARINDLVRKGRIRDSGRREKTRTGRLAICWKAVEA